MLSTVSHIMMDVPHVPLRCTQHHSSISTTMSLSDRVAVVTGASGGIGAAIATALSRAGARVVIGARRLDELERVKSNIEKEVEGANVLVCKTDVTKRDEVKALVAAAKAGFGPVDIMVNNAGLVNAHVTSAG